MADSPPPPTGHFWVIANLKINSLNAQRLNIPQKRSQVLRYMHKQRINILFLQETQRDYSSIHSHHSLQHLVLKLRPRKEAGWGCNWHSSISALPTATQILWPMWFIFNGEMSDTEAFLYLVSYLPSKPDTGPHLNIEPPDWRSWWDHYEGGILT